MLNMDAKSRLLIEIYREYQQNVPNMTRITPEKLCMSQEVFSAAVRKLLNEEMIRGALVFNNQADFKCVMPTIRGIEFVEMGFGITPWDTQIEKIDALERGLLPR